MSKQSKFPPGIPSKEMLVEFIRRATAELGEPPSKREIAHAFKIHGDDRIILKDMIRTLKKEGILRKKRETKPSPERGKQAPGIVTLRVTGYNPSGQLQAQHAEQGDETPFILHCREETPKPGDEVLAKIDAENPENRKATLLRILPERLTHVLGIFHGEGAHGRIEPVNRKIREEFTVHDELTKGAKDGELVYCRLLNTAIGRGRHALRPVEVLERIGRLDEPRSASIIAIQNNDIPMEFPPEAVRIAESAKPPVMKTGRADLRNYDLVTIDGSDARDFDDAVWAEPWEPTDGKGGGWHLLVAIADVAHYVRFGSALDNEAFLRGNSVYFPDRVVPMLPEALSNGLCSLNPDEDRYCLAVHLWIDGKGLTKKYEFVRGIMRSKARLTYEQVQAAHDGEEGVIPAGLKEKVIDPLYGVYRLLLKQREIRGALELDLPEHKVSIDPQTGNVTSISIRERFDSHKLIEECMIAANVAAAHAIENAEAPGMFRVHEPPEFERVSDLKQFLKQMGYTIAVKESITSHHFNKVLEEVAEKPEAHVIHMAILRSQMAAYYHPKNLGHFGLSLDQYCHFTSPIRRYSDLIVHRTLIDIIEAVDKETDGLVYEQAQNLNSIATHISQTERRAMLAEREARERYITNFMADKVGKEFEAVIASVNSFGFFAELRENGAQGLIPLRSLGGDFWLFDKERQEIVGRRTGETFHLGQRIRVVLMVADTLTGSLQFALAGREVRIPHREHRRPGHFHRGRGDGKGNGKGASERQPHERNAVHSEDREKKPKNNYRKLEKQGGKRYKKKR